MINNNTQDEDDVNKIKCCGTSYFGIILDLWKYYSMGMFLLKYFLYEIVFGMN